MIYSRSSSYASSYFTVNSLIVVDGSYWSRTITTGTGLDSTGLYNASSFDHGYVGRICSSCQQTLVSLGSVYDSFDQFDSIEKTCVQLKEHCDSLIAQINANSVENSDLNDQLQEKVFAITVLKNELSKINGKNVINTAVSKPNATVAPGMFKLDIEALSPRLKNNRDAHKVYIEKTTEYTDTLRGFVESARTQYPIEPLLESACMFTKHVQELLVYASQTCPMSPQSSEKLVVVTPINKDKRVRFAKPVTSSNNIPKQTYSLKTKDSNKPLLPSTGVKPTTSASGSKPSGNTKNNMIMRPPRAIRELEK
ncbi:hypothetical protein Tco_0411552 [Tanacetum coccineum]